MQEDMRKALAALSFLPEVYLVGGCVRDSVLGRPCHDVDLCSSSTPTELVEQAGRAGYSATTVGAEFGTVVVRVGDTEYEVTTYRQELSCDGRHAQVAFTTSLEVDLSRRDLTINAMAMGPDGKIIDPFNGMEDLHERRIRTVGCPDDRFQEDYLRVVRALRFASTMGFTIEKSTYKAIRECAPRLVGQIGNKVSIERLVAETQKVFDNPNANCSFYLRSLKELGILDVLIPELTGMENCPQNPKWHPEGDAWEPTLEVVDRAEPAVRWHALLHDVGKNHPDGQQRDTGEAWFTYLNHAEAGAALIPAIGQRLRWTKEVSEDVAVCTNLHMRPLFTPLTSSNVRRLQLLAGEHLTSLGKVCSADAGSRHPVDPHWFEVVEEVKPILQGRHLLAYGQANGVESLRKGGPHFTKMLRASFDYQLEGDEEGKMCTDIDILLDVALREGGYR